MIKLFAPDQLIYDCEWVADPATGRRVYGLPSDMSDGDVRQQMFYHGGADDSNPRPYLKTALCRIVSIAAVRRLVKNRETSLVLISTPKIGQASEEYTILDRFLNGVGARQPQLIGFNSTSADLPALMQRAAVHRIAAPDFCRRPNKPWERIDYFAKQSDWNVDLKDVFACYSYGKATPSLHEIAAACGIPGKQHGSGADVLDLWLAGDIDSIIRYNQRDVLTTYLLWLRVAALAGQISSGQLDDEEARLESMLRGMVATDPSATHLSEFLNEWRGDLLPAPRQPEAAA